MAFKAKLPLLLFFFGSFLLCFTSSLAYERDPEQQLQQCTRLCERQQKFREEQCKQRCVEQYKEQKEQEQHGRGGGGGDDDVFFNTDPQKEYQQCQSRCQEHERGSQQQQLCKQRCEEKRREQEKEEQRGGGGRGGDDFYNVDPQREYQQCQSRCQEQEKGSQQQQCQRRCEEKRRQQEREEQRGGGDNTDPQREYQQCQSRCQEHERGSQQQQQCQRRCEEKRRQQEREEQRGGGDNTDPQREYQQCQSRCQQQKEGQQQQQQCQQRCEEKRRQQEREEQRGGGDNTDPQREYQQCQSRCQQQEEGQQQQQQCQQRCEEKRRQQEREEGQQQHQQEGRRNNPYFFDEQSFIEKYRTQEGRIRVLPKFTQRSKLHRGIENYRLAIFEANPNTFVIPNHWDADAVIYVVKGKGTISMIRQQNRESFNLERGDVIRVPSGSVVYMVNRDNNEQLQIAKLYQPVSTPGQVQEFFGVGAEEPESFYRTFSNEVLEAAFNTPIAQLERLFGQQRQGVIIRASKEQVQALSKQASSSSSKGHLWPRASGESRGPYNLLNEKPEYSNDHGELYEVKPNDYKQLKDLDLAVSFVNITKGAMMAPYYNTRATKLILVVEGRGRFEMACPHLAKQSQQHSQRRGEQEQEEEHGGAHYQKISARLSPRTMFIVPTGHPVAIIASDNENLQLVAFTINAQDSKRNFLAGKENVVNQMEKEAIELGFNIPSKEVQEIFNRQKESYFVPGPNQQQQQKERGGSHGLSILDFVNF